MANSDQIRKRIGKTLALKIKDIGLMQIYIIKGWFRCI